MLTGLFERVKETNRAPTSQTKPSLFKVDMSGVLTLILGGGQGTRLFPLTSTRCKPAVDFGGKYKLVDASISNAINSGCSRVFILTQFLSAHLYRHILHTYHLGNIASTSIELLPAEQTMHRATWYQGTADAVRKNLEYLSQISSEYVLILSGDQIYRMNFQPMLLFARETNADLVIAALSVNEADAKRMGVFKMNDDCVVTEFYEKPQEHTVLDRMRHLGLKQGFLQDHQHIGSMGIYLFKRQVLFDLLLRDLREDFGKHLIPTLIRDGNVSAYLHDGYWEDIGTIAAFHRANIALTEPNPTFKLYDEFSPLFSHSEHLPPPRIAGAQVEQSIICDGAYVEAALVKSSILGPRTRVKRGTTIRNSYVMGHDSYTYTSPSSNPTLSHSLHIGEDCILENVILDRHVSLGNGVQLVNKQKVQHYSSDTVQIRDGIIVVANGASLPDGFVL